MRLRDLSAHSEYVPGRGTEEVARELGMDPGDLVKLSSNENPHGPSPDAVAAVRDAADAVNVYPTATHADLTDRIADRWGVDPAQVWPSPGADGAIDYLSRTTLDPGDAVLVPDPGFAYYGMSARYHHGEARTYPLWKGEGFPQTSGVVLSAYGGERIVYLTSPHNPTGAEFAPGAVEEVAEAVAPETLVVVDEAYGEYTETPSAVRLLDDHDNLAVLRTFSKAYGLAGLRVGYAVVPPSWADAYAKVNTPFAVNEVACRAALAAIDDEDHLERVVGEARWARGYLRRELAVPTFESAGNFVLADVGDAARVAEAAKREGVIVRDCTSFGLPGCVRVSCGTREDTRTAVDALNRVVDDLADAEAA
jgi:histidinol-phosphate aminotransferase